jgi:hypothetical protein
MNQLDIERVVFELAEASRDPSPGVTLKAHVALAKFIEAHKHLVDCHTSTMIENGMLQVNFALKETVSPPRYGTFPLTSMGWVRALPCGTLISAKAELLSLIRKSING